MKNFFKFIIFSTLCLIMTGCFVNNPGMQAINEARAGSMRSSALGYVSSIEVRIELNKLDGNFVEAGTYSISELDDMGVTTKGRKPVAGCAVIDSDGNITDYSFAFEGQQDQQKLYIVDMVDWNDATVKLGTEEDLKSICK